MRHRWFTGSAATNPRTVQPQLTVVELTTLQQILDFAADPNNAGKELMHCLDAAGTVVHDISTGDKAAPITQLMRDAIAAEKGVRLWHNHPSQDSLSHHDWLCSGASSELEVLAVNVRGSMFVGRIELWDDRLHKLLEWLPRLAADLEFYMSNISRERNLDLDAVCELPKFTGHVLNSALANHGLVQYGYRFLPIDQTLIDVFTSSNIIVDGASYAAKAIEDELGARVARSETGVEL